MNITLDLVELGNVTLYQIGKQLSGDYFETRNSLMAYQIKMIASELERRELLEAKKMGGLVRYYLQAAEDQDPLPFLERDMMET